ncbi:MAG TPA: hypothetical protein VMS89_04805 [Methanoregulaceae archaeon]|nr:hypothetical protein [Methanoregulaceae archaeon]
MKSKDKDKSKNRDNKKAGSGWNATKIAIVVVGVLFVVLMIVSSLGMQSLNFFSSIKPGDTATVSYTIRDDLGRAIVTSDSNVFNQSYIKGDTVFFSQPLQVQANRTTTANLTRIPVIIDSSGTVYQFGLFRDEMNLISKSITGMKSGQTATISLVMPFERLENNLSREQFDKIVSGTHKNSSEYAPGDQMILAFSESPIVNLDPNTTPAGQYFRTFYIENISSDSVIIKGGYSTIDLNIQSVKTG